MCCNDHTTDSSSKSIMLYFCSFVFRNLLSNAMRCHPLSYFCSRHAFNSSLLAWNGTRVGRFVSKCLFLVFV